MATDAAPTEPMPLECFPCPNGACDAFNKFAAGTGPCASGWGQGRTIRRLYSDHCPRRLSACGWAR